MYNTSKMHDKTQKEHSYDTFTSTECSTLKTKKNTIFFANFGTFQILYDNKRHGGMQ
jgi:nucleoid DNA-binding protein